MSGYTKGPWEAVQYPEGWAVRTVYVSDEGYRTTTWPAVINAAGQPNEANAHLIAASPDMYEALKEVTKELSAWAEITINGVADTRLLGMVSRAKAALSKAEGTGQ